MLTLSHMTHMKGRAFCFTQTKAVCIRLAHAELCDQVHLPFATAGCVHCCMLVGPYFLVSWQLLEVRSWLLLLLFILQCIDYSAQPLPRGYELVFSRDSLQHVPLHGAWQFLNNVKASGAKYLLVGSYLNSQSGNVDVPGGESGPD